MSLVHFSRTSPRGYEGKKFPAGLWIRANLEYEIYPVQDPHGQVRHPSKVNVALVTKGRIQTINPNAVSSNDKSRQEQVWY
jgi:hypothetical protein